MSEWCYDAGLSHTTFRPIYDETLNAKSHGTLALPPTEIRGLQIHSGRPDRRGAPPHRTGRRLPRCQCQPIHGGKLSPCRKTPAFPPRPRSKTLALPALVPLTAVAYGHSHMTVRELQAEWRGVCLAERRRRGLFASEHKLAHIHDQFEPS
jgi:hypothetical protein